MSQKCVLVVEDDADTRTLLHYILEHRGFEVIEAEGAEAALQILHERRPDLILTDLMMPVMDGVELIHRLRLREELSDVPIVAMSAHSNDHLAKAYDHGATAMISKPFDVINLVNTLDGLLPKDAKVWH